MVFLSAIFPLDFAVLLGEPALRAAPFVGTSPTSQRMVEVASGYFLYDIVLCMLKYSGENTRSTHTAGRGGGRRAGAGLQRGAQRTSSRHRL